MSNPRLLVNAAQPQTTNVICHQQKCIFLKGAVVIEHRESRGSLLHDYCKQNMTAENISNSLYMSIYCWSNLGRMAWGAAQLSGTQRRRLFRHAADWALVS